jgi:hypothetical protein
MALFAAASCANGSGIVIAVLSLDLRSDHVTRKTQRTPVWLFTQSQTGRV